MPDAVKLLNLLTLARPPGHIAARRTGSDVSFAEFLNRVSAWRTLLARNSQKCFALYLEDGLEFAGALFGAWQAGKTIFLPGDHLPATCAGLSQVVGGFLGNFAAEWSPTEPGSYDAQVASHDFRPLDPEFVGVVLYTSGTTGAAQPIFKKLGQLAREVATLEKQFGSLMGDAEILTTVSHQHIYGLLFQILWPLAAGRAFHTRTCDFLEELSPALSEHDCVLVSSPAHLRRLPENHDLTRTANRLRVVFCSGGPLQFEVVQETVRVLGRVPIEVYGSSETGGIAWRRQHSEKSEDWTPFDGVVWQVDGETGVLKIRSPNLPDDRWYTTADRAEVAGDGVFRLRGRVDRIAKIEGKRISLNAIEYQLKTSPLVTDARVIVLEQKRQRVAAFIVLSKIGRCRLMESGKLSLNRSLRDLIRTRVEAVGVPRVWRYLETLPVDTQGKATQTQLKALLDAESRREIRPRHRLLERGHDRAVVELTAPRDLLYFDGHFPGRPILAGVVQIDWVIAFGRRYFDLPPFFRGVHALKFQRVIPPDLPFRVELTNKASKRALSFKITSGTGTHASGRIIFGAQDD
jgi:acyl-coenzyme A synthetase/AMP-(fatty) acid ligase/3-hydroxymyristoyl/3-hydroxydecanoyl-(acyl carrier protein) dehydratase